MTVMDNEGIAAFNGFVSNTQDALILFEGERRCVFRERPPPSCRTRGYPTFFRRSEREGGREVEGVEVEVGWSAAIGARYQANQADCHL